MLGNILKKIRNDKKISKESVARIARINVGHLSHIENEQRNPSNKTLKLLCSGLNVPSEPLLHISDVELTQEQVEYNATNHFKYDSIPIINSIMGFGFCPPQALNASFILKPADNSMSPKIGLSDFMYVELYVPLSNKDIGIFLYNSKIIVRKFVIRKNDIVLRAENSKYSDIVVKKDSDFYIIGKVIGKNNSKMNNFVSFY